MPAKLDPNKTAVDFGISIRDSAKTLEFYCDILGLEHVMDMPMPAAVDGAGIMHRVACGATTFKFVRFDNVPAASNPAGGPGQATGFRYLTIWVTNIDELVEECRTRGVPVTLEPKTIRPGVRIAFLTDPDGNAVELLENTPV